MRAFSAWLAAALVGTAIAGCPGGSEPGDAGIDARSSSDAGTDALLPSADAGLCPIGGSCTLGTGAAGRCCAGACVDPATDGANCGGCATSCGPDRRCRDGRCEHASCASVVSSGTAATVPSTCPLPDGTTGTCCDGACRSPDDFRSDDARCGACGIVCPAGVPCTGGTCGFAACDSRTSAPCPPGTTCPFGDGCERSDCAGVPDGSVCALPRGHDGVCCAGACVDTGRDGANCGACGNACPAGTACSGSCITPPPCTDPERYLLPCLLPSGGLGDCCGTSCVDLAHDALDCVGCGVACPVGSTCSGGELCVAPLADGGIEQVHCGSDADCPSGFHCLPGVPFTYCGRDDCAGVPDGTTCGGANICCGGACVDSSRDPNCGGCGAACPSGVCVGLTRSGGGPALTCLPDARATTGCEGAGGCPPGDRCVGGVCVAETCPTQGPFCVTAGGAPGQCCSAGDCADLASDPTRCGSCLSSCAPGQTCERGRCTAP